MGLGKGTCTPYGGLSFSGLIGVAMTTFTFFTGFGGGGSK
jgi:hypothetical protein